MDLTVRGAAAIFHVPESQIYRWINELELPSREVDGQPYFNRTELLEWATVRRVEFTPDLFEPSEKNEGLIDALELGGIISGVRCASKAEALRTIVDQMRVPGPFDRSILLQLFLAREAAGSTAVGNGIAVPHARYPVVLPVGRASLTIAFLERPVDFGFGAEGSPFVRTLLVLVSPTIRAHLRMLARIACALRDEPVRAVLQRQGPPGEILAAIRRVEASFESNPVASQE